MSGVVVNGTETEIESGRLIDLLMSLGAARPGVAAAINGEVVPRSEWEMIVLKDGDVVEIVTAVAGG